MADKKQAIIIKRKSGGGHGGAHGGAWKVAYADFVTAMMAFFMVMWLMGADEETKSAIAHYFNHPFTPYKQGADSESNSAHPMGEREGAGENILNGLNGEMPADLIDRPVRPIGTLQNNEELLSRIQLAIEGKAYGVDVSVGTIRFSVPEELLFDSGSHTLRADAGETLDKLGSYFKPFKGKIHIIGHTDSLEGGHENFSTSYEFSLARAVQVMNYLMKNQGIPEDRLMPVGNGGRRALAANTTELKRERNRRIEFLLTAGESAQ